MAISEAIFLERAARDGVSAFHGKPVVTFADSRTINAMAHPPEFSFGAIVP